MKVKSTQTMKDANVPREFRCEVDRTDYPAMDPALKEAHDWASINTTGEDVYHVAVRAFMAGREKGIEANEELEHLRAEVQALRAGTFALVKDRDTQFNLKQDIGARYNKLRARLIELGEDV
jgi:hypothetical protein